MGKYKTKAIQTDLVTFAHILEHSARHIQEYSGIFRTLCNPDIFRTLLYSYSKPWQSVLRN